MKQRPFVLLTTLVFAMAACSGSDDATTATDDETTEVATTSPTTIGTTTVPDTTVPVTSEAAEDAADVFSFADDDLCTWVTGEEITRLVSAVYPWDGTAAEGVPEPPANCLWRLSGDDGDGYLSAGDAGQWTDFSGQPYDVAAAEPIVEYSSDDPGFIEIGTAVTGHPALRDGWVVRNAGFGQYAFWMPPEERYLAFSLAVPGVDVNDLFDENRFFAVADELLQQLGWVATTSPAVDEVGKMNGWSGTLDGVTAGSAPPAAACPEGTAVDFDEPVPVPTFLEPQVGPFKAVAAFDTVTNSVVVVRRGADSSDGAVSRSTVAGRLDVCSGEWSSMNADFGAAPDEGPAWLDALVYDVDSDALVGFSTNGVHVYDRAADEWSIRPYDTTFWVISAAYHPASGRIVVITGDSLAAYDVDEAEWEWIFQSDYDPFAGEILGIDATLDKIVIVEGVGTSPGAGSRSDVTRLVDPVTGDYTDVPTPGRPIANIYNGFGPEEAFGQIAGTVFVSDHENDTICGFNGETLAWDLCVDSPLVEGTPTSSGWAGEWAIVGDPINDRLIAIPPSGPIRTTPLP
ncbi:MAG: hypothetical protein WCA57_08320 [Ilumatobacteraceae bacterium]